MVRIHEQEEMMQATLKHIIANLSPYPFPYMTGYVSTIEGMQRMSMMLTVSLDEKSTWKNHILENSRYAKITIDSKGTMSMISGYGMQKLRKSRIKSTHEVITKLHMWGERSLS